MLLCFVTNKRTHFYYFSSFAHRKFWVHNTQFRSTPAQHGTVRHSKNIIHWISCYCIVKTNFRQPRKQKKKISNTSENIILIFSGERFIQMKIVGPSTVKYRQQISRSHGAKTQPTGKNRKHKRLVSCPSKLCVYFQFSLFVFFLSFHCWNGNASVCILYTQTLDWPFQLLPLFVCTAAFCRVFIPFSAPSGRERVRELANERQKMGAEVRVCQWLFGG